MSQNKPEEDRIGVLHALETSANSYDNEVAKTMREHGENLRFRQ